ncbi:MAG TPA: AAA family ATPase, partial [Vicinamibacteria bacterium]|nr:AAA family ATPase [Vicinamibacteria bacterium]
MRMLGAARHGETQVASIEGPAGIGKTRLAEEALARAARRGGRAAVGRCWQDGDAPPLWPWRAILHDLGAPPDLLEDGVEAVGRGRVGRFLAVRDHFRRIPRTAPLVILLDDVHLADPATLLLARFLTRERTGMPLLLVLTSRDVSPGPDLESRELLAELGRSATVIRLTALDEAAVAAYLAAAGERPDAQLLRVVAAVTKGNPLHLRSLKIQSGLKTGGLQAGLERVIGDLLEQLPPADQHLVRLAALLGPEVSVHEAARIAEVPPALAAESLSRARELGLMAELEGGRLGFVHELVRDAAVSGLSASERLDAHARAARILAGHQPEQMLRRAHHALAAADRSTADAETAVAVARDTARALHATEGYESAAALFGRAALV